MNLSSLNAGGVKRTLLPALALAVGALSVSSQESWLIRADAVYTASGDAIEGGAVLTDGARIAAVGPGVGGGDEEFACAAVTPGLVDLSPRVHTNHLSVEQSTETPFALDTLEGMDLWSYRFQREAKSGVTSVLLTPADYAVIGGLCGVVKTAGDTLEERLVKRAAVLRGSLGSQPSAGNVPPRGGPPRNFYARRPTTRMGVEWTWRKAYYDAKTDAGAQDADQAQRNEILRSTLNGNLPVSVQAWTTQDVRTAVYLKEEFGVQRMFVDAAAEAWREPELLARSGMAVALPPWNGNGRTGENAFLKLGSAADLHALGIPVALTGHGEADPAYRLARQPGYAMRGGLPFDAALAAVTIVPARLAGVDDRVGSIAVGKDADLVLWSGTPFEPTSQILAVFVSGKLIVDNRQSN